MVTSRGDIASLIIEAKQRIVHRYRYIGPAHNYWVAMSWRCMLFILFIAFCRLAIFFNFNYAAIT